LVNLKDEASGIIFRNDCQTPPEPLDKPRLWSLSGKTMVTRGYPQAVSPPIRATRGDSIWA